MSTLDPRVKAVLDQFHAEPRSMFFTLQIRAALFAVAAARPPCVRTVREGQDLSKHILGKNWVAHSTPEGELILQTPEGKAFWGHP